MKPRNSCTLKRVTMTNIKISGNGVAHVRASDIIRYEHVKERILGRQRANGASNEAT